MRTALLAASALLLLAPVAAAGDLSTRVSLVRTTPALDGNARGQIRIRGDGAGADERLTYKAKKVDLTIVHEVWLETAAGSGVLQPIGTMQVNGDDLKLDFRPEKGEALPFGAATVTDLAGRAVEIRQPAGTVLVGIQPTFLPEGPDMKGQTDLSLPPFPAFPQADARLKLRSRPWKGDERFRVRLEDVSFAGKIYTVHLETADGSGVLANIGTIVQKPNNPNQGRFDLITAAGAPLPFGVPTVLDLVGRQIEVRDELDQVVASGVVSALVPN